MSSMYFRPSHTPQTRGSTAAPWQLPQWLPSTSSARSTGASSGSSGLGCGRGIAGGAGSLDTGAAIGHLASRGLSSQVSSGRGGGTGRLLELLALLGLPGPLELLGGTP